MLLKFHLDIGSVLPSIKTNSRIQRLLLVLMKQHTMRCMIAVDLTIKAMVALSHLDIANVASLITDMQIEKRMGRLIRFFLF